MSDLANAKKPVMVAIVHGKVKRVRRFNGIDGKGYFTTIITPAPDEYSKPNAVEIWSKEKLADVDDITTVDVQLGGYEEKSYQYTDKETGEKGTAWPVKITLKAIEK